MLSVIIIVKNEETTIRRCLHSVQWADEIIVLDSGSSDNTVNIAKEYTAKVYSTDWQGYGVQKQRALERASGDWILNLDADEVVSEELKRAILFAIEQPNVDAYRVPIQINFYDKPVPHSLSPKRHIRLFKRLHARYSNDIVHEKVLLPATAKISRIRSPLMHYCFRDVSHVLTKINRYSSYSAKIRTEKNKPAGLTRTLIGTAWMFFRCYFLQLGFLDGKTGFLLAIFSAQGTFFRGIKQIYPDLRGDMLPCIMD